jgi:hypothetical protein
MEAAMDRIWDDMLYPKGVVRSPDAEEWKKWREEIRTGVGGLAAGFRSEILLRCYKVIEDMTGNVSFIQAWTLAITGRLPTREEDRLLNAMIINTAIADPRFWFNKTARLNATLKTSPAACMTGGIVTKDGKLFSAGPAYNTAKFFKATLIRVKTGQAALEDIVRDKIEKKEIITGFGRVLARGKDERNDSLLRVARQCGLDRGEHLALAFEVEKLLQKYKSPLLFMNSGGLRAGLLLDMKFEPHQIMMFYMMMFVIGMAGNITEAYEQAPGQFLPLTDDDIEYKGRPWRPLPAPSEKQRVVHGNEKGRVVVMDSISHMEMANRGDVIVAGSHGGVPAIQHGLSYHPMGIIVNDAGRGKEDAGIKGLDVLDAAGLPGAAASAQSARIGDGMDSYENGVVSAVNKTGHGMGIREGMRVKEASHLMLG